MKKKSIIVWALSLAKFMIFYMAFFPAMAKESASFKYFDASYILNEMSLESMYVVISILIIVAGIVETLKVDKMMG